MLTLLSAGVLLWWCGGTVSATDEITTIQHAPENIAKDDDPDGQLFRQNLAFENLSYDLMPLDEETIKQVARQVASDALRDISRETQIALLSTGLAMSAVDTRNSDSPSLSGQSSGELGGQGYGAQTRALRKNRNDLPAPEIMVFDFADPSFASTLLNSASAIPVELHATLPNKPPNPPIASLPHNPFSPGMNPLLGINPAPGMTPFPGTFSFPGMPPLPGMAPVPMNQELLPLPLPQGGKKAQQSKKRTSSPDTLPNAPLWPLLVAPSPLMSPPGSFPNALMTAGNTLMNSPTAMMNAPNMFAPNANPLLGAIAPPLPFDMSNMLMPGSGMFLPVPEPPPVPTKSRSKKKDQWDNIPLDPATVALAARLLQMMGATPRRLAFEQSGIQPLMHEPAVDLESLDEVAPDYLSNLSVLQMKMYEFFTHEMLRERSPEDPPLTDFVTTFFEEYLPSLKMHPDWDTPRVEKRVETRTSREPPSYKRRLAAIHDSAAEKASIRMDYTVTASAATPTEVKPNTPEIDNEVLLKKIRMATDEITDVLVSQDYIPPLYFDAANMLLSQLGHEDSQKMIRALSNDSAGKVDGTAFIRVLQNLHRKERADKKRLATDEKRLVTKVKDPVKPTERSAPPRTAVSGSMKLKGDEFLWSRLNQNLKEHARKLKEQQEADEKKKKEEAEKKKENDQAKVQSKDTEEKKKDNKEEAKDEVEEELRGKSKDDAASDQDKDRELNEDNTADAIKET